MKPIIAWIVAQKNINKLASEVSFFDSYVHAHACKISCGDGFEIIKVHIRPLKYKKRDYSK